MEYINIQVADVISTVFYTFLGVLLMGVSWWVIDRITHYSISTEIQEKQNIALAIVIGALFVSLAIIVSTVIAS
jgi:uncharacterized membrane protein YjfL (UPF0719 family)